MNIIRKEPYIFQIQPNTFEPTLCPTETFHSPSHKPSTYRPTEGLLTKAKAFDPSVNWPQAEPIYKPVEVQKPFELPSETKPMLVLDDLPTLTTESGLTYYIVEMENAGYIWQEINKFLRGKFFELEAGGHLPWNFPVGDMYDPMIKTFISFKSHNLSLPSFIDGITFERTLIRNIDKLANFTKGVVGQVEIYRENINHLILQVAIPHQGNIAQELAMLNAKKYAQEQNIKLEFIIFKDLKLK